MNEEKVVHDALVLWNRIKEEGGLDEKHYDKEMVNALKLTLGLPAKGALPTLLKKHSVSVEALVYGVFSVMEPFSHMMSDLLKMLADAGAQQTDHNIKIKFNFTKRSDALSFDIEKFRQIAETFKKVTTIANTLVFTDNIWSIRYVFDADNERIGHDMPESSEAARWIQAYHKEDIWPEFDLQPPVTGTLNIDNKIRLLWNLWRIVVGHNRNLYDKSLGRHKSQRELWHKYPDDHLIRAELDCWTYSIVRDAYQCIEGICALEDSDAKIRRLQKLEKRLDDVLSQIKMEPHHLETMQKTLTDILNLPIWKKRYELYAAWISTQIISTLEDTGIQYCVKENTLSFSFAGSHLATCTALSPPLEIWAELRTAYDKPISSKRKKNIQPDYSLTTGPADEPNSSLLVVECKQYKKSSLKNFSEAIQDYAGGRPQATILLANYGPINKSVINSLPENVQNRAGVFSYLRPESTASTEFRSEIRRVVQHTYAARRAAGHRAPWFPPECPVTIRLTWGENPRDLDMHLVIRESSGQGHHIYYGNQGLLDSIPYAALDCDVTNGLGPETITINRWLAADYDIYVHNFSGVVTQSDEAIVVIEIDGKRTLQHTKKIGQYPYWHVCTINQHGKITPIQQVLNRIPIEIVE